MTKKEESFCGWGTSPDQTVFPSGIQEQMDEKDQRITELEEANVDVQDTLDAVRALNEMHLERIKELESQLACAVETLRETNHWFFPPEPDIDGYVNQNKLDRYDAFVERYQEAVDNLTKASKERDERLQSEAVEKWILDRQKNQHPDDACYILTSEQFDDLQKALDKPISNEGLEKLKKMRSVFKDGRQ